MAERDIPSTKPLIDKLGVKPESAVAALGINDAEFLAQLQSRTADIYMGRLRKDLDQIFFGADSIAQLRKLERLKGYIKDNGAVWVVSVKGKQARIRDVDVIAAAKCAGLVDNKVVSFSATHTALRLVIPVAQRQNLARVANLHKVSRCAWGTNNPLMIKYHDEEWGVPVHDDRKLFEFLVLDGFQAGVSWSIILNKRQNFRKAFHNFSPKRIAKYAEKDVRRLLADAGIIRNRLKIRATISNAQRFLEVQKEFSSFDKYIWQFVGGKPIVHKFKTLKQIPATSKESDAMSKDLKARGFKFVGSTICYAFMQAAGLVNDHTTDCFRYKQLKP